MGSDGALPGCLEFRALGLTGDEGGELAHGLVFRPWTAAHHLEQRLLDGFELDKCRD